MNAFSSQSPEANEVIVRGLQSRVQALGEMILEAANREAALRAQLIEAQRRIAELEPQLTEARRRVGELEVEVKLHGAMTHPVTEDTACTS